MGTVLRTGSQRRHLAVAGHGQKVEADALEGTAEGLFV
jgi:hypothetical protein